MVSSTSLFDLIKLMTPSEKRYFKIYAAKHAIGGKNKYERLFDIVEKQDTYNEREIKKLLHDEKMAGYFAAAKNYLYDMVKDSLHIYHLNLSTESILKKELHQVSIIYQKGLYKECEKLLRNIKKKATEVDNYLIVYETLLWEDRVIRTVKQKLKDNIFLHRVKEEALALEKVKNQDDYSRLMSHLSYFFREYSFNKKPAIKKSIQQLYSNPILLSERHAITTTSKILFNYIHQMYNFYVAEKYIVAFDYGKKNIKIFESSVELIRQAPLNYVRSINNHIQVGMALKYYHECETIVKGMKNRIEKLHVKTDINSEAKIFLLYAIVITDIFINEKKFEKIHSVIDELSKKISQFKGVMNIQDEKMLYFNISYLYFAEGDMKSSLSWLNILLNMPDPDSQKYVVWAAKFLAIMIRVELQDMEFISYMQKSTYRFLLKKNAIGEGEKIFFSFIKKLLHNPEEKKLAPLYKQTKAEYSAHLSVSGESPVLKYLFFTDWLNSRIAQKPIAALTN
jgi:hypothetical protein